MRQISIFAFARLLLLSVALFVCFDLSREQLGEYVSGGSRFLELPSGATVHYRDRGPRGAPTPATGSA